MRRRYCFYTIVAILAIVGIVFAAKKNSSSSSSSKQTQQVTAKAPPGSYVVESQTTIPEIKAKVKVMKHKKSGMPILTIIPDDSSQDAVFGISFRTKVADNSGIAYVVQKSIQDGSKNYPIKGPFNQLTRGSLQTYMENWIERDRASFTYASRNLVDFSSGIKVYLDAVFNPNVMEDDYEWIFRQEAWRFLRNGNSVTLSGYVVRMSCQLVAGMFTTCLKLTVA
jgi:Zn-dependent M16 (insulinase) family peptidase